MAADLQTVGVLTQVVGVMDGPARKPQHLAFELGQDGEVVAGDGTGHGGLANGSPKATFGQMTRHWLPIHTTNMLEDGRLHQSGCQKECHMPKRTLDDIDRKILVELQADGRMSLNDLAAKV